MTDLFSSWDYLGSIILSQVFIFDLFLGTMVVSHLLSLLQLECSVLFFLRDKNWQSNLRPRYNF